MSSFCIHGFASDQCAACRTCDHGLITSRCGRCAADASTPRRTVAASRRATPEGDLPESEQRGDWEIFYVPALSGWQVRGPEEAVIPTSYRSLFLARKAVDDLVANPPAPRAAKRGTR